MIITPASYHTNRTHRDIADRVMAAGTLTPEHVYEIEATDEASGFLCSLYHVDDRGVPIITAAGHLSRYTVVVRP